jgi:hypothetical protein
MALFAHKNIFLDVGRVGYYIIRAIFVGAGYILIRS